MWNKKIALITLGMAMGYAVNSIAAKANDPRGCTFNILTE